MVGSGHSTQQTARSEQTRTSYDISRETFTVADNHDANSAFTEIITRCDVPFGRVAGSYEKRANSPVLQKDDFLSLIHSKLVEWLHAGRNLHEALDLLASEGNDAVKWFTTMARNWCNDEADRERAECRDRRKTINASPVRDDANHGVLILDDQTAGEPSDARLAAVDARLSYRQRKLLALLMNPPKTIVQTFQRKRVKVESGPARVEHDPVDDVYTIVCDRDALNKDPIVHPLEVFKDNTPVADESLLTCRDYGTEWVLFGPGALIRLDKETLTGEWCRRAVRPSRSGLDVKAVAEELGWPDAEVRRAWSELKDILPSILTSDPDLPEDA